jgi:hypothetical protein
MDARFREVGFARLQSHISWMFPFEHVSFDNMQGFVV